MSSLDLYNYTVKCITDDWDNWCAVFLNKYQWSFFKNKYQLTFRKMSIIHIHLNEVSQWMQPKVRIGKQVPFSINCSSVFTLLKHIQKLLIQKIHVKMHVTTQLLQASIWCSPNPHDLWQASSTWCHSFEKLFLVSQFKHMWNKVIVCWII